MHIGDNSSYSAIRDIVSPFIKKFNELIIPNGGNDLKNISDDQRISKINKILINEDITKLTNAKIGEINNIKNNVKTDLKFCDSAQKRKIVKILNLTHEKLLIDNGQTIIDLCTNLSIEHFMPQNPKKNSE
jgi:hypothetical protein